MAKKIKEKKQAIKLDDDMIEVLEEAQDLGGRPTLMTNKTVALLLNAFSSGFTDEEACLYTNISKNTLYRYIEKHPEFGNQKELLKNKPKIKAKMNLLKAINNEDLEMSKWYLERKSKQEFSLKQEVENNTNLNGEIIIKLPNNEI